MTTLKDLTKVRQLRLRVDATRRRIQLLTDTATNVSVQLTGMPKGGGRNDRLEEYADKMREAAFELLAKVTVYEEALERIDDDLDRLPNNEEQAVRLYYCEGMTWDTVAFRMHYGESHCRRLRDRAIKRLEKM